MIEVAGRERRLKPALVIKAHRNTVGQSIDDLAVRLVKKSLLSSSPTSRSSVPVRKTIWAPKGRLRATKSAARSKQRQGEDELHEVAERRTVTQTAWSGRPRR